MRIARLTSLLLCIPAVLCAQRRFPPDSLQNVKVLPATMPVRDLINVMRGFTSALGVRCTYCHVGTEGQDLASYDFASDEKAPKETARTMLRMVQAINGQHLSQLAQRRQPRVDVQCATCHRGVAVPRPLPDLLVDAATTSGADSAVRAYRSLRAAYFGRSAYDFGEFALIHAAQRLQQGRKFDEALALLRLNLEFQPMSSPTSNAMGDVNRVKGDTAAAIAAYRNSLRLNENDQEAMQRLRALGQTP
jgi:tetratricopeptide (TPR) repeat protein